jgi:hypothetical protein
MSRLRAVLCCLFAATAAAQGPLQIEREEDRAERAAIAAALRVMRCDVVVQQADVRELAAHLRLLAGGRAFFLASPRLLARAATPGVVPPVTLALRKVTLLDALGVLVRTTELRFVVGSGVVFLEHREDVHELTSLRLYDLRAAVATVRDFPGPRLDIPTSEPPPPEPEAEPRTICGFTADGLVELIKAHVTPEQWSTPGGPSLSQHRGILIIRHTESGHRAVQELLHGVGVVGRPLSLGTATAAAPAPESRPVRDTPASRGKAP